MTDYTGVGIEDIIKHLSEWRENTNHAISKLESLLSQVKGHRDKLYHPDQIEGYIIYFVDLFKRYSDELNRLIKELPLSIEQRHVEALGQLFDSSQNEERKCTVFKTDFIQVELKDESLRHCLIDPIYEETKSVIIDYRAISNVVVRIKALVGLSNNNIDALELKPNLFGIGLNFNYLIKKFKYLFRRK